MHLNSQKPVEPCNEREPALPFGSPKSLRAFSRAASIVLILLFLAQSSIMSDAGSIAVAGLQVLALPFRARFAAACIATVSVALVTFVYALLIQRGSLMATASWYPRRPIESNISRLLNNAWPRSTTDTDATPTYSKYAIQLFYIGKMAGDGPTDRTAKGRLESLATPIGEDLARPFWLTSGSALTKNVVQLLIWEWACLWLLLLMIINTLLFNGFFTDNLNPDSYPRLTVMTIYLVAYAVHFSYVWMISLHFLRNVCGGAAWSLLERAKFVVAQTKRLKNHNPGAEFQFRSIDKANDQYVPTTFPAILGTQTTSSPVNLLHISPSPVSPDTTTTKLRDRESGNSLQQEPETDPAELRAALATISASQKSERDTATQASTMALDRVIANAMVLMGVTLSSGFASWTSTQMSENSPNNTATTQIGSLALLASLSLGAATMFSSAMHLDIMSSAFRTIIFLKETKINGLAIDHYRKRRTTHHQDTRAQDLHDRPLAFTQHTLPLAEVSLGDFFAGTLSGSWRAVIGMISLGPAFAMLPRQEDHDRRSAEVDFDFVAPLEGGKVILTTRETDKHAKRGDGANVEAINVCYREDTERYGKETC